MSTDQDLKTVEKTVGDIEQAASDLVAHSYLAALPDLLKVAQDVSDIISAKGVLLSEWEQLDDAAKAELSAYVSANDQFPANANIELIVQMILKFAIAASDLFQIFIPKK